MANPIINYSNALIICPIVAMTMGSAAPQSADLSQVVAMTKAKNILKKAAERK